jgi:hypothetical protein
MSKEELGNCHGDANPDAWFPTVPNGGRPSTILRRMVPEIKYALNLCNTCTKKSDCLEEGLKPVNLAYGIWGGLLAGERIAIADERGDDYMVAPFNRGRTVFENGMSYIEGTHKLTMDEKEVALSFAARIKPYLEE